MFKLSPQEFTATVASLKGIVSGDGERRQFIRMTVEAPVKTAFLTDGKVAGSFVALSRNISPNDIGLRLRDRSEPGEHFLICLFCEQQPLVLVCQTASCRLIAHDIHAVGARFDSMADPATEADFLRHANVSK